MTGRYIGVIVGELGDGSVRIGSALKALFKIDVSVVTRLPILIKTKFVANLGRGCRK